MTTATTKTEVPAIYAALGNVFKGIANVPKNGVMKFGQTSYTYLKADDVQAALNPLLTENNIIVSSAYAVHDAEKGARLWTYVDLELRYYSTVDGSTFPPLEQPPIMATGESITADDKSVNKALTQALKNAHRATFQFESGEPEADDGAPAVDRTQPTATEQQIARAGALKPGTTGTTVTPGALTPRQVIKEKYLDGDNPPKTLAEVNALKAAVTKETGKTGDDLYAEVLARLDAE